MEQDGEGEEVYEGTFTLYVRKAERGKGRLAEVKHGDGWKGVGS